MPGAIRQMFIALVKGGDNVDKVGTVTHYYDKLGVAIVKPTKAIKVGDRVRFGSEEEGFIQTVESMELNHEKVSQAKRGDEVGIKVDQKAKEGTVVYSA